MSYDTGLQPLDLDLDIEALERAVALTWRERLERRRSGLLELLRTRAIDLVLVGTLLVIAYVVHVRGMYDSPARFDDEGTYTAYAWAVQYEHRLGHYTYWYAHPPLGWMQIAAWNWLTDAFDRAPYAVAAARQFMVVCKLVSVALLYGLALRLRMTRVGAVLTVLLFALSPLAVYFTRTALLDNIVTPWLLGAFYLAASPRRSLRAAAGSATCFAVAVLSKETALLFLPALALLFWQCSDRRNRRFGMTVFTSTLVLLGALYPAYALIKNELFMGPGHVSLEWAVRWQLFDRQGSGSIFDPHSTAHAVTTSWLDLDPYLPKVALALLVPGLLLRRTRAVTLAFGIQVFELLRKGYLPYPFVVAMIPFGALVVGGVVDAAWQAGSLPWPPRVVSLQRRVGIGDLAARSALTRPRAHPARPGWWATAAALAGRAVAVTAVVAGVVTVAGPWRAGVHDLWHSRRDDASKAAFTWVRDHVTRDDIVVVDDAFWVDLVRSRYPQQHVVWFTKLDVDRDVRLPAHPAWRAIDYVVLNHQDELSVHLTADSRPSRDTLDLFPTLGGALQHGRIVARYGTGLDAVTVWRVDPTAPGPGAAR